MMDKINKRMINKFLNQSIMEIDVTKFGYSNYSNYSYGIYDLSVIYFKDFKVFKITYSHSEYRGLALSIYISLVRMLYQLNLFEYKIPGGWEILDKTSKIKTTQDVVTRSVDYCRTLDIPEPNRSNQFWVYNLIYECSSEKVLCAPDIYSAEKVIEYMTKKSGIKPKIIPIRHIFGSFIYA